MRARTEHALRTYAPYVLLVVFALAHIVMVVHVMNDRGALEHDEIISQLEATGHLDDWTRAIDGGHPTGEWVSGVELRRFLEVDDGTSPGAVQANVTDLDIHPPLYFWLLSGARSAGLGAIWSGPVLGIVFSLLAAVVLFSLLVDALRSALLASLAIGVFLLSPALLLSTAYARQYPLLMLEVVTVIWVVTRLLKKPRSPLLFVAFFVIGVLGFLTSPTFAFPFAGACLTLAAWWIRGKNVRSIAYGASAALASAVAAVIIHPGFQKQYDQSNFQTAVGPKLSSTSRVRVWFMGFGDFVSLEDDAARFLKPLFLVAAIALVVTSIWWGPALWRALRRRPVIAAAFGVTGFAILCGTGVYVLKRVPPHAAGWEYFIAFWPGIVIFAALAVRRLPRPTLVMALIVILMGTYAWRWQQVYKTQFAGQRIAVEDVSHATLVVADCTMRGYTPGAAMWVPRDSKFLLAARDGSPPPPIPKGADLSRAYLLHVDVCSTGVRDIDGVLKSLHLARGPRVGPIGYVMVERLTPG